MRRDLAQPAQQFDGRPGGRPVAEVDGDGDEVSGPLAVSPGSEPATGVNGPKVWRGASSSASSMNVFQISLGSPWP